MVPVPSTVMTNFLKTDKSSVMSALRINAYGKVAFAYENANSTSVLVVMV